MRRKKEEQDLFNFSFVDILATTIGVLIFIMVLTLLNSVNRASNVEVEDDMKDALAQNEVLEKKLGDIKNQFNEEEKLKKGFNSANIENEKVEEKYREGKEREKKLKEENKKLEGEIKELQQEYAEAGKEAGQLKEKAVDAQIKSGNLRERVTFRIPEEKVTGKQPVIFECANSKVYTVAEGVGSPRKDNYTISQFGNFISISRNPGAKGETLEGIRNQNSDTRKLLNRLGSGKYYAVFIVRTDSFAVFRELRSFMWGKNWDLIWEPYPLGSVIMAPANASGGNTVL